MGLISFKDILKGRNVEGRIYLCDIKEYFHVGMDKAEEIRNHLEEIQGIKNENN